jgi:hypothetical protein
MPVEKPVENVDNYLNRIFRQKIMLTLIPLKIREFRRLKRRLFQQTSKIRQKYFKIYK